MESPVRPVRVHDDLGTVLLRIDGFKVIPNKQCVNYLAGLFLILLFQASWKEKYWSQPNKWIECNVSASFSIADNISIAQHEWKVTTDGDFSVTLDYEDKL